MAIRRPAAVVDASRRGGHGPDAGRRSAGPILGNFHLIGGRFCCVQGERRIFVLDAESGRVLWARRSVGAGLRQPYPVGRFLHVVPAGAGVLLVQTAGGRRWLLDAATGRLLHDDPTASNRGPARPSAVRRRHPAHAGRAAPSSCWTQRRTARSGRTSLPGVTTLTGEAPRLSVGPDALLLAWATNIGWRVQRLDWPRGSPPGRSRRCSMSMISTWMAGRRTPTPFTAFVGARLPRPSLRPVAERRRSCCGSSRRPGRRADGGRCAPAPACSPIPFGRAARNFNSVGCWDGYNGKVDFPPEEEPGRGFPIACHDPARAGWCND